MSNEKKDKFLELCSEIKETRQSLNISTTDLEKAGLNPATYTVIENGNKGFTITSLLNYFNTIEKIHEINTGEKIRLTISVVKE